MASTSNVETKLLVSSSSSPDISPQTLVPVTDPRPEDLVSPSMFNLCDDSGIPCLSILSSFPVQLDNGRIGGSALFACEYVSS